MTQTAKENNLKEDMLKHVPDQLWSEHETDVGLVKSANPVHIDLKPNTKLQNIQYSVKPEAEQGISKRIQGLIDAGVLVETQSYCNTPILPIVQNWPAEVPNPHTVLTHVPPEAKYFMVTDLCSAFFKKNKKLYCKNV